MNEPAAAVEVKRRLGMETLDEVRALIDAATTADGVRPLNEHVMLHLRHGGDEDTRNLLARDRAGTLVGYAHLDVTDEVAGPSAELVVHPMHRGHGHGRALVEAASTQVNDPARTRVDGPARTQADEAPGSLTDQSAPEPGTPRPGLRLWSHGSHPSARELAARMGFTTVRSLWQMRRSLYAPIPEAPLPPGVAARTFQPEWDADAWLGLNARAFADHAEQGGWTREDLDRRMAEAWFDPGGFFLAERDAGMAPSAGGGAGAVDGATRLVGFHWTKVHGGRVSPHRTAGRHGPHEHRGARNTTRGHGHDPIGEVYVLGVDPDERGEGIGHALTVIGLCHLRDRGLAQVMLYVDEANKEAIRLYESLGFIHWDTDTMYARA